MSKKKGHLSEVKRGHLCEGQRGIYYKGKVAFVKVTGDISDQNRGNYKRCKGVFIRTGNEHLLERKRRIFLR